MLMQIATRAFESRVHLLDNGPKQTNGELLDQGLSLRKKVEHSRAHGKKWGARRVRVLKMRRASRCGALILTRRAELAISMNRISTRHLVTYSKTTKKIERWNRKGHLIKDLLRCGGFPGRKVGVILVVALAERSGAGWLYKVK